MTLNELKEFVKQKGFFVRVNHNVIKIPNYRDYTIYLYQNGCKNYIHGWDVCYGDHWPNQEDKVFNTIIEYINKFKEHHDRF